MTAKLTHVIEFVAEMDRAVRFYRDVIGFQLKFESPEWSEFSTGETTFALHSASEKNPAGKVELGLGVPKILGFYEEISGKGVQFPMIPTSQDFGGMLAQFVDSEGAHITVSGE